MNDAPVRVSNGNKRGTWLYDINGSSIMLDNGLSYNADQMKEYLDERQVESKSTFKEKLEQK